MAGYALQGSAGFNPFLMDAEPVPPPNDQFGSQSNTSNPFLSDFTSGPSHTQVEESQNANPFLSFASNAVPVTDAGNPFAQFLSSSTTENSWGIDTSSVNAKSSPFFSTGADDDHSASPPMVPRSTQDLLQTVTGSLEATSDSLMDRLRLAQPSPVPMPPSPTPSPRSPSPDLWGDEDAAPHQHHHINPPTSHPESLNSLLDLYESAPNISGPKSSIEILGLYNTFAPTTTTTSIPVSIVAPIESINNEVQQPETENTSAQQEIQNETAAPLVASIEPVYTSPPPEPVVVPQISEQPAYIPPKVEPVYTQPTMVLTPIPPKVEPTFTQPPIKDPPFSPPADKPPFSPPAMEPTIYHPKVEPAYVPSKPEPPVFAPMAEPKFDLSYTGAPVPVTHEEKQPELYSTTFTAPAPERPKPPPVPSISQRKPLPNRPPPPMPPAPRIQPSPVAPVFVPTVDPFQDSRSFPDTISQAPKAQPSGVSITQSEAPDFDSFEAKFNSLAEPGLDSVKKSPSPFESLTDMSAVENSSSSGNSYKLKFK